MIFIFRKIFIYSQPYRHFLLVFFVFRKISISFTSIFTFFVFFFFRKILIPIMSLFLKHFLFLYILLTFRYIGKKLIKKYFSSFLYALKNCHMSIKLYELCNLYELCKLYGLYKLCKLFI